MKELDRILISQHLMNQELNTKKGKQKIDNLINHIYTNKEAMVDSFVHGPCANSENNGVHTKVQN